ncbi:uncharacterized protein N7458_008556, partial [Penicillium daleae]
TFKRNSIKELHVLRHVVSPANIRISRNKITITICLKELALATLRNVANSAFKGLSTVADVLALSVRVSKTDYGYTEFAAALQTALILYTQLAVERAQLYNRKSKCLEAWKKDFIQKWWDFAYNEYISGSGFTEYDRCHGVYLGIMEVRHPTPPARCSGDFGDYGSGSRWDALVPMNCSRSRNNDVQLSNLYRSNNPFHVK